MISTNQVARFSQFERPQSVCQRTVTPSDVANNTPASAECRTSDLNFAQTPAVDVEILEFNEFGPKLAVRPYCHTGHYWQVYFETNKTIADTR